MSDRPAIEIYSIGTELLNGQIQDTNSFWMAQQIAALGGYVRRIAILDDDMDELTGVLKDACQRGTRVVITTGGLGPTPDDMTVEAIAKIMGWARKSMKPWSSAIWRAEVLKSAPMSAKG